MMLTYIIWRAEVELLTAVAIGILFAIGIFQILRRNVIRSAIGLIILANAINLFLLSTGDFQGIQPAYVDTPIELRSDALPQALVLTAIVISMGGISFVLSILYVISARYKTSDLDEIKGLKN
jgi:multicomponent Na+:H+ antiporter subunit C